MSLHKQLILCFGSLEVICKQSHFMKHFDTRRWHIGIQYRYVYMAYRYTIPIRVHGASVYTTDAPRTTYQYCIPIRHVQCIWYCILIRVHGVAVCHTIHCTWRIGIQYRYAMYMEYRCNELCINKRSAHHSRYILYPLGFLRPTFPLVSPE